MDPYLYCPYVFIACTQITLTSLYVLCTKQLTTAAATTRQACEPCCGPARGLVIPAVRADDLLLCVETLRCARRNNRWESSKVLRTETDGRTDGRTAKSLQQCLSIRGVWGKPAERWQRPLHTVHCYHFITFSKPGFGMSQSIRRLGYEVGGPEFVSRYE